VDDAWLDPEEQQAWSGLMTMFNLLDVALDRQLQQDSGLSHTQYGILSRLSRQPGRTMHMSELAASTSSSQSRLSHAVTGMEAKGWVSRSRCLSSRRMVHATLTAAGYDLAVKAAPGHVREVRRLVFDQLSRERMRSLIGVTQAVLNALEPNR